MQLTIDKFGRMVLPKPMRDDLGIEPGDRLEATQDGDAIVLRPVCRQEALRHKGGVLVFAGKATADVTDAVREQRQQRLERIGGWRKPS